MLIKVYEIAHAKNQTYKVNLDLEKYIHLSNVDYVLINNKDAFVFESPSGESLDLKTIRIRQKNTIADYYAIDEKGLEAIRSLDISTLSKGKKLNGTNTKPKE